MKFKKQERFPFRDTGRKRSYVLIRQRKEREKLPLFADEIAESQPSVEDTMADRARRWTIAEAANRKERARQWIIVRRRLKLLPDHERQAFLRHYYRVRYPLDPGYMGATVYCFIMGRLVMHNGEVEEQAHLDFLSARATKIATMPDDELLRRMQNPYAFGEYLDLLRAERARRASQ